MKKIITASVIALSLGLTACDVNVEEEGKLPDVEVSGDAGQMPEYEINQTQEGEMPDVDVDFEGGNLPEVDVETPDVDVTMEKETVKVPNVDVEMPEDK